MEVVIAKSAGFCYGVSRALDAVLTAACDKRKQMYTLGPLIHNPQVMSKLEEHGVKSVGSVGEVPAGSIIVMPSHGVSESVMTQAAEMGLEIIDVTCPFVSKVHRIVGSLTKAGYQILILGDQGHTEVQGILSKAGNNAIVLSDATDLAPETIRKRVGIVAQTTQTVHRFSELVSAVSQYAYEVRAYNTICNATSDRQRAALDVAQHADVMVVVGGRNSANTRRLAEICSEASVPTHHVEVADEIEPDWFDDARTVGVTAGASTPDWVIGAVISILKAM